jgi:hypothetical protein
MDISSIRPLPQEFKALRDELRCVGYELVHYTNSYAVSVAAPIKHSANDFLFGFHKIFGIYAPRVIIENHTRRHCGKLDVPAAAAAFLEQERPARAREMAGWFKDPANLILSLVVPPYGLTMFGLSAVANRQKSAEHASRKSLLIALSDMPEFQEPYRQARIA